MKSKWIWMVSIFGILNFASASADEKMGRFFLEPDVGYVVNGTVGTSGAPADSIKGLSVGGRAGVRLGKVLMIGPSFKYLPSISYTPNGSTTAMTPNPTAMTLGGFAGLAFSRFRVWGGYNFMDSMSNFAFTDPTLGSGTMKITGASMFFGASLRVLGPISINGEYVIPTYKKATGTIADVSFDGDLVSNVTGKYIVISLSAPISF